MASDSKEILLRVDSIDVFYGKAQALWNVSLDVRKGEIVTLIGPNGAGKTTTVRTIYGGLKPRNGSVEFMGERLDKIPPNEVVEKGIVVVPEGRRLFPIMNVMENLEMGAFYPEARKMKGESLEWIYSLFPILKERRWQRAGTLSGGQQQMLAIARALMARPKTLLLDEPSLGLAPILAEQMFDVVRTLNKQGVTIFLVEQNTRGALLCADRGYVLETGRIVKSGEAKELLNDEHVRKAYLGL